MTTLSRLTNAVLLLAVVALSVALMRTAQHAPAASSPMFAGNAQTVALAGADQAALLPAALLDELNLIAPAPQGGDADDVDWSGLAGHRASADDQAAPQANPEQAAGGGANGGAANANGTGSGDADGSGAHRGRPMRDRREGAFGPDHRPPADPSRDPSRGAEILRQRLTPELVARCVEVAREVDKELGDRLADARDKNPQEFDRMMRQGGIGWRLLAMAQLKQHDPDLYRAKLAELQDAVQIDQVARKLREARRNGSQGDADAYENQLRSMLQIQLAMSIKARGEMFCRLDERVSELRKDLEREAANFNKTIDARMKVLTAEAPPAAPAAAPVAAPRTPAAKAGE